MSDVNYFKKKALDFALQKANDHAINLITDLLERLSKATYVTYDQLKIVSSFL